MKKSLLAVTALCGIFPFVIPIAAHAQSSNSRQEANSSSGQDNTILVTARRRAESVQDVPIVVETITAQQIQDRGIANIEDIAAYTPGLVFDRGISLQDTRPVIRGLPATRGRPPVGVLLDGIDISTEALGNAGGGSLLNTRLLDLERIEVVKGPQSALYGRAAFAGAINYISRRPTDELEGEVRGSYGSFNTWELGGSVSGPVSDTLGFRVNVAHAQSDGDYDSPVTGADLNAYDTTGGSVALEFDDGGFFTAYLRASYSEYEYSQSAIQSLSGFVPGNVSRPDATTPEGQAVAAGRAGGALASALTSNVPARQTLKFTGITGYSIDPRTGLDFPGSDGDVFTTTLNLSADLGGVQLIYNGGYIVQNERLIYDGDFFGLPLRSFVDGDAEPLNIFDYVDFDNNLEIFSQELRFQSLDSEPFRWALGGLVWFSDTRQESRSIRAISGFPLSGSPAVAGFSGNSIFEASVPNVPASPFRRNIESYSAYGLVEYDITDALTVSAEARYIDETTSVVRSNFVQAAFAPVPAGFVNPQQRDEISDDAIVPRFGISYQPNSDLLLYASAAKGFKPAGISELDFGSALIDSRFLAESVWNYEVGAKTTLADGQLILNGALFYMDWTDKQVSQLVEDPNAPSGFRASVRNAGAAEVMGADISLIFRPDFAPGFTFDVGYTYLDTEYTDFTIFTNSNFTVTEAANCTVVQLAGRPVCEVTYNGNQLERAPRHQVVSNLSYRQELSTDVTLMAGASVQYQGSRFLSEANRLTMPSYVNVDMQLGIEFNRFKVQGFVRNLTNDNSVRSAQNNFDLSTFGRSVNIYAPPRRLFGVRTSVTF